jgi:hypothetical protein
MIVLFPENIGRYSLNLWSGRVAGTRLRGEETCQGVVVKSSSNWKSPYFLMTLVGFVVDWTMTWWLYKLQITDEAEGWIEEAPPVPLEPPLDVILWMIGKGEKDKLDESDKVLLRELFWVDKTTFLLPISAIGLIYGDKSLLLLEIWGYKDMKRRSKL